MIKNEKEIVLTKTWAILLLAGGITAVIIIAGTRFSNAMANASRLSSAMQTVKSSVTAIAACRIGDFRVYAPDDANNPKNAPCLESGSGKYVPLGGNTTAGCVYNTAFVPTFDGAVPDGAIQVGCGCRTSLIKTCDSIFQCDFATDGKCTGKDLPK
jgi:hypothetical protein